MNLLPQMFCDQNGCDHTMTCTKTDTWCVFEISAVPGYLLFELNIFFDSLTLLTPYVKLCGYTIFCHMRFTPTQATNRDCHLNLQLMESNIEQVLGTHNLPPLISKGYLI